MGMHFHVGFDDFGKLIGGFLLLLIIGTCLMGRC